jgi:hypothetical protein
MQMFCMITLSTQWHSNCRLLRSADPALQNASVNRVYQLQRAKQGELSMPTSESKTRHVSTAEQGPGKLTSCIHPCHAASQAIYAALQCVEGLLGAANMCQCCFLCLRFLNIQASHSAADYGLGACS